MTTPIDSEVDIPDNIVVTHPRTGPAYGVERTKKKQRISPSDVFAIKRYLCWPVRVKLPRCAGKVKHFVLACEERGDFSHSDKKHQCEECQCKHTAGMGTVGDYYGLGDHTGHYGAGFCFYHELGQPRGIVESYAIRCINDMRHGGLFRYHSNAPYLKQVEEASHEAKERTSLRAEFNFMRSKLQEFEEKCTRGPAVESKLVEQLHQIHDQIDSLVLINKEDEQKKILRDILDALDDRIFRETTLTESSKSGPVEASDMSRFKMAAVLATAISKVAVNDMRINEVNYVSTDDVVIRTQQTIALTFRILATGGTKDQWLSGFKEIWTSLKTVNQK